jgi:hypothetical protein
MQRALVLASLLIAACGGSPPPAAVVVAENEAGAPAPATVADAGKPLPDAPSAEVAALLACGTREQNEREVRDVLTTMTQRAKSGPIADRALVDAVWTCFTRFRPSQAKSINLLRELHGAVLAVKDASYGPKAAQKIAASVVLVDRLESMKDGAVRLAMVDAIDHLSPNGDEETAKKLEALVESETAAGMRAGVDEMLRVALRLRARAL